MATPFTRHEGVCVSLLKDNIDTDQIIPSREMKRVSKTGLGDGLFAGWRYRYEKGEKTEPNPEFELNRPEVDGASILLSGKNFGCGSSREHAVWALRDFGIRAILAESFGRIFHNNCARNRLLAVALDAKTIADLHSQTCGDPRAARLVVDLENCEIIAPDGNAIPFEIDPFDRSMLLNGLDHIDETLRHASDIAAFIDEDRIRRRWSYL